MLLGEEESLSTVYLGEGVDCTGEDWFVALDYEFGDWDIVKDAIVGVQVEKPGGWIYIDLSLLEYLFGVQVQNIELVISQENNRKEPGSKDRTTKRIWITIAWEDQNIILADYRANLFVDLVQTTHGFVLYIFGTDNGVVFIGAWGQWVEFYMALMGVEIVVYFDQKNIDPKKRIELVRNIHISPCPCPLRQIERHIIRPHLQLSHISLHKRRQPQFLPIKNAYWFNHNKRQSQSNESQTDDAAQEICLGGETVVGEGWGCGVAVQLEEFGAEGL